MAAPDRIRATVVYCGIDRQHVLPVDLPPAATLRDAVLASGILTLEPSLASHTLDMGVFNQPRSPETLLRPGDRVEVYRPLTIDPKQARRVRAEVRRRRKAA
jgi:uncharacterized protein